MPIYVYADVLRLLKFPLNTVNKMMLHPPHHHMFNLIDSEAAEIKHTINGNNYCHN